jgi:hypothetical protein
MMEEPERTFRALGSIPNSGDPKLTLYNFSVLRRLAAIALLWGTIVHAADLTTKLAHIMRRRSATAVAVDVSSGDEERRLQAIGEGDYRESRRSKCSQLSQPCALSDRR